MERTTDVRLDRIVAELQDLRYELREATSHLPKPGGSEWVTLSELGKELRTPARTVAHWRDNGIIPAASCRQRPRGSGFTWLVHRQSALEAVNRFKSGS